MKYLYRCTSCQKEQEVDICMKDYDRLKNNQRCSCGGVLKRIIEWRGIACGNGDGWCGKSTGNAI